MRVKATTKRQTKTEAELLDHATNNLLRAVKQKIHARKTAVWITTNFAKTATVIGFWPNLNRPEPFIHFFGVA